MGLGRNCHHIMRFAGALAIGAALGSWSTAWSQPAGRVLLHVEGGAGTFELQESLADGTPTRDGTTASWSVGGDLGVRLPAGLTLGFRYTAYFGSLDLVVNYLLEWQLDATEVGGFLELDRDLLSLGPGSFRAGAGIGLSRLSMDDQLAALESPGGIATSDETFASRLYATASLDLSRHLRVRLRGGYAFADFGEVTFPVTVLNGDGDAVVYAVDHSGFYATLGLGRWF